MARPTFNDHINELNANLKKNDRRIKNYTSSVLMPTGDLFSDYGGGINHVVYDDDEIPVKVYHNIGTMCGGVSIYIGKSNTGKTQLALKKLVAMAEPFLTDVGYQTYFGKAKSDRDGESSIVIADSEHTLELSNTKRITNLPNKLLKRYITQTDVSTDIDLMALITSHCEYKSKHMKPITMPLPDLYGDPIVVYPPTFMLIDSMSNITVDGIDGMDGYAKSVNNMAGAQRAKRITTMMTIIVDVAQRYNINFAIINHINKNINTNSFGPVAKQYRGLKQDESLGGGERGLYLAAYMGRIDHVKDIDSEVPSAINMGEGISGAVVRLKQIKSKTNVFGFSTKLIHTNEDGYNFTLSALYEAIDRGWIAQKGYTYYLDKYPDKKFTLKRNKDLSTYYKTVFADPEMLGALYDQLRPHLAKFLSSDKYSGEDAGDLRVKGLSTIDAVRDSLTADYGDESIAFSDDDILSSEGGLEYSPMALYNV